MNEFFYNILHGIQGWVGSWGVAMIIFTILIRTVLTPLDFKSRKSMRKTTKLQPKIQELQKKYANDKEKLNQKTAELYRKEHINPLSSCLPLLLTWPILIIIFNAMRMASNLQLLNQVGQILDGQEPQLEKFLWVKNLWMPDNLFRTAYPDEATLRAVPLEQWRTWLASYQANIGTGPIVSLDVIRQGFAGSAQNVGMAAAQIQQQGISGWTQWVSQSANINMPAVLQARGITSATINSDAINEIIAYMKYQDFYTSAISSSGLQVPLFGWTKPVLENGWLLLPILSALTQVIMTKVTTAGQPTPQPADGKPNTGKFMQWFFPIFSIWICLSSTSAFALYWVAGNIVSLIQTLIINKVLDDREKKAAGVVAGEGTVK